MVTDEPARKPNLSPQDIAAMRRERDTLAACIRQSEDTLAQSRDLLRRLDEILAAYAG
jgi:hypothetical protein